MLNLKTLANKKTFTKPDGTVVVDLIRRAVSFFGVRVNAGKAYIVTEETAMRADLIANYFYNDSGYMDLLLKYNGYSNPFSLNVGDVLRIPPTEVLSKFKSSVGEDVLIGANGNDGSRTSRKKSTNIVLAPKTKKDKARLKYLLQRANAADANLAKLNVLISSGVIKAEDVPASVLTALQGGNFSGTKPSISAFQKGTSVPVPPNVALDNGVKIEGGKIIFGSDVTTVSKEDCTEPISRTKLKETLLKNKIA